MQSKISLKLLLLIISIAGIAFFSIIIFFPTFDLLSLRFYIKPASPNLLTEQAGNSQSPQDLISSTSAGSIQDIILPKQVSLPARLDSAKLVGQIDSVLSIRLKIPKINVDATLESVGLTPEGAVDVPKNPTNAAWFDLGPRPGENGSAIITGHYGRWENGTLGVFNNLYKLQKGDKLYVEDGKGTTTTFVVRESRSYEPNADAPDVFISNDGRSHLNLITCEGIWDKVSKSYSERLVVFTDKE